jgi:hypothetical protein
VEVGEEEQEERSNAAKAERLRWFEVSHTVPPHRLRRRRREKGVARVAGPGKKC